MALPSLATPAALAALTGLSASDPTLVAKLRAASREFRAAVHHDVSLVTDDQVELNGSGSRILMLPDKAVVSVSQVLVDGYEIDGYRLDKRNGILERRGAVWPRGLGRVHVTYTHGYDSTTVDVDDATVLRYVPEDIQSAVLGLAQIMINTTPGLVSRTVLGDTAQFGTAATVGRTQAWTDAVNNHALRGGV